MILRDDAMDAGKILFLPPTPLAEDILSARAREILESLGHVVWNETGRNYRPDELAELLPDATAVVTSWGSPRFTPELVAAAQRLRIIGHAAGSVKSLAPKEVYDAGIVVLSAAPIIAASVAEYTLWGMLSMQRDLYRYEKRVKVERGWRNAGDGYGSELYYKRVGIIAASHVGRRVIELLRPFSCDVVVYDPYLSPEESHTLGVRLVSLEELCATCDIVSVHAPTTDETKGMVGPEHFKLMKHGALFVNTARAWVVDQAAMVDALRKGRIRAVLDVFDPEPLPADHPLRDMDNVFLTPHISAFSSESRLRLVEKIAEDIQRFFAGEAPRLAVPWERLAILA